MSAYTNSSGFVMHNGVLQNGNNSNYYAVGKHGSGIGDTRKDFTKLSYGITQYIKLHYCSVIDSLSFVTVVGDFDILRQIASYCSIDKYSDGVQEHSKIIADSTIELLKIIQKDNKKITDYIRSN